MTPAARPFAMMVSLQGPLFGPIQCMSNSEYSLVESRILHWMVKLTVCDCGKSVDMVGPKPVPVTCRLFAGEVIRKVPAVVGAMTNGFAVKPIAAPLPRPALNIGSNA